MQKKFYFKQKQHYKVITCGKVILNQDLATIYITSYKIFL